MVRSKSKLSCDTTLSPMFNAELNYVKRKNIDLAKSLSELQQKYKTLEDDKELLLQELLQEKSDKISYNNKVNYVNSICKEVVTCMTHMANLLTNMMEKVNIPNDGNFLKNPRRKSSLLREKCSVPQVDLELPHYVTERDKSRQLQTDKAPCKNIELPRIDMELPRSDTESPSTSFRTIEKSLKDQSLHANSMDVIVEDDTEHYRESSQNFSNNKSSYRALSIVQEESEAIDITKTSSNVENQSVSISY